MQALVARSTEVMSQDAAPVNFSMIIWALGSMNYHPGQAYMRDVIAHLQASRLIQRFDAQVRLAIPCRMFWRKMSIDEQTPHRALQICSGDEKAWKHCALAACHAQATCWGCWLRDHSGSLRSLFSISLNIRFPLTSP